jgi:hypothetical protein
MNLFVQEVIDTPKIWRFPWTVLSSYKPPLKKRVCDCKNHLCSRNERKYIFAKKRKWEKVKISNFGLSWCPNLCTIFSTLAKLPWLIKHNYVFFCVCVGWGCLKRPENSKAMRAHGHELERARCESSIFIVFINVVACRTTSSCLHSGLFSWRKSLGSATVALFVLFGNLYSIMY